MIQQTKIELWQKLAGLRTCPKNKKYSYLHGIMYGLDYPEEGTLRIVETDMTTYYGLVLDNEVRKNTPLKDILTNKSDTGVVDRIKTTDPEEAKKFFETYNVC